MGQISALFTIFFTLISEFKDKLIGQYIMTIALIGILYSGIMMALYVFNVIEPIEDMDFRFSWLKFQLVACAVLFAVYLQNCIGLFIMIDYDLLPGAPMTMASIFTFLGFLCAVFPAESSCPVVFYIIIALTGFVYSTFMVILHVLKLTKSVEGLPVEEVNHCWVKFQLIACVGESIALLVAILLNLLTVAALFGFVAFCAYVYDAIIKGKAVCRNAEECDTPCVCHT